MGPRSGLLGCKRNPAGSVVELGERSACRQRLADSGHRPNARPGTRNLPHGAPIKQSRPDSFHWT